MGKMSRTIRDFNHHTLTQNLKAMSLCVPSLIYPLFPPFLVDVRHNHSHLITQQSGYLFIVKYPTN